MLGRIATHCKALQELESRTGEAVPIDNIATAAIYENTSFILRIQSTGHENLCTISWSSKRTADLVNYEAQMAATKTNYWTYVNNELQEKIQK